MPLEPFTRRSAPLQRIACFLLSCAVIAVVWLMVLPRIAHWAPIRNHIERMHEAGVNVGAKFYTELNWDPPTGPVWR